MMAFLLPNQHQMWQSPAALGVAEHCLLMESGVGNGTRSVLAFFVCTAFAFPVMLP